MMIRPSDQRLSSERTIVSSTSIAQISSQSPDLWTKLTASARHCLKGTRVCPVAVRAYPRPAIAAYQPCHDKPNVSLRGCGPRSAQAHRNAAAP